MEKRQCLLFHIKLTWQIYGSSWSEWEELDLKIEKSFKFLAKTPSEREIFLHASEDRAKLSALALIDYLIDFRTRLPPHNRNHRRRPFPVTRLEPVQVDHLLWQTTVATTSMALSMMLTPWCAVVGFLLGFSLSARRELIRVRFLVKLGAWYFSGKKLNDIGKQLKTWTQMRTWRA